MLNYSIYFIYFRLYEPSIESITISLTGENKRATCKKFETGETSS